MVKYFQGLVRDERGISALEYAILAAVIIGVIVIGLTAFGEDIGNLFTRGGTAIEGAGTTTTN